MSQFQQPGISNPEDKFTPSESNGALLLFFPTGFQSQVKTVHGESDAIAARIVRLNDGRVWENALVFSTALITQLQRAIPDGMVLGTLGQGENTKGNPPWLLRPHTEQEVAIAEQWLAQNPRVSQPAPTAPAAQGWGAPPTQSAPAAAWGQQPPAPAPAAPATGGWGSPPAQAPAAGGWGAPAPQGNGVAPAPQQSQFPEQAWGNAQAPAPAAPAVDPGLVQALLAKGYPLPPGSTQQSAEQLWAMVGGQ